jgi:hypothetical protein
MTIISCGQEPTKKTAEIAHRHRLNVPQAMKTFKIFNISIIFSLSLSLSLTHTHTHTLSLSLSLSLSLIITVNNNT